MCTVITGHVSKITRQQVDVSQCDWLGNLFPFMREKGCIIYFGYYMKYESYAVYLIHTFLPYTHLHNQNNAQFENDTSRSNNFLDT